MMRTERQEGPTAAELGEPSCPSQEAAGLGCPHEVLEAGASRALEGVIFLHPPSQAGCRGLGLSQASGCGDRRQDTGAPQPWKDTSPACSPLSITS